MHGWKCHMVGEAGQEQKHQSYAMPAASQCAISCALGWHCCSSLPCQRFAASVVWGAEGDALAGLDLCEP